MPRLKSYSIGLLAAGMLLIAGSCVPLAQTVWSGTDSGDTASLVLPPGGGSAMLDVPAARSALPMLRLEVYPAVSEKAPAKLRYALSVTDQTGRTLFERDGSRFLYRQPIEPGRDVPAPVDIPLQELALAPGKYAVRFDTGTNGNLVRSAELRLLPASSGLLAPLLTTLMLAILGWLTASLGALQWVRAEAARPIASADAVPPHADEERLWTTGCHLSALLGYLLPFGHVVGPLAVWLAKRRTFPAVEQAGRNVLNFQLSITLYALAGLFLSFFLIGILVLFLVVVFQFSTVLYASLRAQRGLDVRYPLTIKLI